jgi:ubiquinone/menaquinone biosynthesis C-methylase UbiE
MTETKDRQSASGTKGRVLHSAARYDFLAWLLLLGREGPFRERLVRLARLEPGQSVLDIGCGTGSLAIAAKRRVGPSGTVQGIDASPEMIARARKKAGKAGVDVAFTNGVVESLPFPDRHFDAVLSTLMLHHLPRAARQQCAREMRRVLKPGGRVLAVDFGGPTGDRKSLIEHFHRHGRVDVHDIINLLSKAGFEIVEAGAVGMRDLNFVLATA